MIDIWDTDRVVVVYRQCLCCGYKHSFSAYIDGTGPSGEQLRKECSGCGKGPLIDSGYQQWMNAEQRQETLLAIEEGRHVWETHTLFSWTERELLELFKTARQWFEHNTAYFEIVELTAEEAPDMTAIRFEDGTRAVLPVAQLIEERARLKRAWKTYGPCKLKVRE